MSAYIPCTTLQFTGGKRIIGEFAMRRSKRIAAQYLEHTVPGSTKIGFANKPVELSSQQRTKCVRALQVFRSQ